MSTPNENIPKNLGSRLVASQPSVPATTVALANPTGFDCFVYIYGGTDTVVDINGTQVGTGTGMYSVAAGDSIAITYSAAPSWSWWYTTLVS